MSFSRAFQRQILDHILRNADVPNIGDAAGLQNSSAEGTMAVSLHTADPGETGNLSTNEAAYTSYARASTNRSTHWNAASDASPAESTLATEISFPEATGGSETETHFGLGFSSGDTMYLSGTVTPNIVVSSGVTPKLKATTTKITLE